VSNLRFPDGFVWGSATSAYQIEGSPLADGAGMSIQHRYAHMPGNTVDGMTGDLLADHYRRWPEDIELMKEIGLGAYQFSIAWPRVLPNGRGVVNKHGLDFYDRLLDALLEAGIRPAPILHVWDYPTALQDRGGWANRESAEWFAEYASVVFDRLGDREGDWMTLCEPLSIAAGGYIGGLLAPRIQDLYAGMRAGHHVLLAHGRAVEVFRASGASGTIGTSTGLSSFYPATDSEADRAAAERYNLGRNALYLDPVMRGEYPEGPSDWYGEAWPEIRDGDLEAISAPIDFLGVTYYTSARIAAGKPLEQRAGETLGWNPATEAEYDIHLDGHTVPEPDRPSTDIDWPINPDGLYDALLWLRDRYGEMPLVITEVGAAYDDEVVDGRIEDRARIEFLADHLRAAHRAIEAGIDLRGCFVWSLLDTWEFWLGCTARFGLVHIDYETQERTLKDSGRWFSAVIAANGVDG